MSDQLSGNQLRIIAALEKRHNAVVAVANVPDLDDFDTDIMIDAVENAVEIPFEALPD